MPTEQAKREKSDAEIVTFPEAFPREIFLSDTARLNGLTIRKTLYTRVAKGRPQYKQVVTFDFKDCTLATLVEYAITALAIAYQDGCRGDEPFWGELETYLSSNPDVTVNVSEGTKGRRNQPAILKMSDDEVIRLIELQKKRRGPEFASKFAALMRD